MNTQSLSLSPKPLSALFGIVVVSSSLTATAADISLLTPNYNGMVHVGEAGQPDAEEGFRSVADRALIIDGSADALGAQVVGATGLTYAIETAAGVLDIVHLGNRNLVAGGGRAFDPQPDGDRRGIQPNWLLDVDQTVVTNDLVTPMMLKASSAIGFLYQISDGGGDFDVTFGFEDGSAVTVTLNGPDWFSRANGVPDAPQAGVAVQENLPGDFLAADDTDLANSGNDLLVTEAVITADSLLAERQFDVVGRQLSSLTFGNRSNARGGYAIIAGVVSTAIFSDGYESPTLSVDPK